MKEVTMKKGYINAVILTMNEQLDVYTNGYISFDEHGIISLGAMEHFTTDDTTEWIDAKGYIVMPGMINTHTHLGMIPFRTLGDDMPNRLERFLFPLEQQAMTKDLVYHSSKYAMAEMLLAGITTFCDMYYFEDVVATAAHEMMVRAYVGQTIIDQPTPDSQSSQECLDHVHYFIEKWQNHPLITPMLAPHAPYTTQQTTLKKIVQLAQTYTIPITMHVAEMAVEMATFEKNNSTPFHYLHELGFFNCLFIMTHCIYTSKEAIALLQHYPTVSVSHCIGANTKSAKGVAPIEQLLNAGVTVSLGTDGPSSGNTLDLFTQMKLFANFHKTTQQKRDLFPANTIVPLVTRQAAKALQIDDKIGTLTVGKQADIVVIETDSLNMFPLFDYYAALVYSAQAHNVYDVYVNGKQLVSKGQLCHVDLKQLKHNLHNAMTQFSQLATQHV